MKAYAVTNEYNGAGIIVFADTPGKAKQIALTDEYIGACSTFTGLKVHREKAADKYYKEGFDRLDWANKDDREILQKFGFTCLDPDPEQCAVCPIRTTCPEN